MKDVIIIGLASFTLTYFLMYQDGPFDLFVHIRTLALAYKLTSLIFKCHWCLSTWVCILITLVYYLLSAYIIIWLAAIAIANLVFVIVQKYG